LKGCARHEDFYISGRGLNLPLLVKDYDLMKWIGANSYRTSHYPYSEEEMQMADRCGMLIIDEIPAVGLGFEDGEENIRTRLAQCKRQLQELIARDKNHPSVIMWSIANEPQPPKMIERLTGEETGELGRESSEFFEALFRLARDLDPSRLVTLVGLMGGPLEWQAHSDVVCLNRYWGWYTQPGQIETGVEYLGQELDSIYETLGKPILLSEFGADTVAGMHSEPPKMWTEEYQVEMIRAYLDAADARVFVVGTHVWNFADFQAVQSIRRVGGMNLKGVFTRDRKPKMAAHFLRERWSKGSEEAKHDRSTIETQPMPAENLDPANPVEHALKQLAAALDGKRPGVTKTLKFDITGAGIYRIVIEDGATRLKTGDGEADATMQVKLEDAVKIFTRKLNPMVAVMTGKIKLSGDAMAFTILQG
jgi:beta-glucuronidase